MKVGRTNLQLKVCWFCTETSEKLPNFEQKKRIFFWTGNCHHTTLITQTFSSWCSKSSLVNLVSFVLNSPFGYVLTCITTTVIPIWPSTQDKERLSLKEKLFCFKYLPYISSSNWKSYAHFPFSFKFILSLNSSVIISWWTEHKK